MQLIYNEKDYKKQQQQQKNPVKYYVILSGTTIYSATSLNVNTPIRRNSEQNCLVVAFV